MSKDTKTNREYFTKEYSKFKKTRGNRPIDPGHVASIKKSIAARDLELPIYVNQNMEIRDGHHTFQARKELDLGIYYIVIDSKDALDMAIFNAGRKDWNMNNFLNFHCIRGKQDYKILKSKMEQYQMPVIETHYLLLGRATGGKQVAEDFKHGNFKIPSGNLAAFDKIAYEMKYVNNIFNSGNKLKRPFIRAFSIMRKHPNYDFNRLKAALKSKASKLLAATSSNEYITQLDTVYNSGLADKSRKMNLIQFAKDREYEEDNVNVTIN